MKEITKIINSTNDEEASKINWTKAWSKKYPILVSYKKEVDVKKYSSEIKEILEELERVYNYNELESMLVLKDIIYNVWKDKEK